MASALFGVRSTMLPHLWPGGVHCRTPGVTVEHNTTSVPVAAKTVLSAIVRIAPEGVTSSSICVYGYVGGQRYPSASTPRVPSPSVPLPLGLPLCSRPDRSAGPLSLSLPAAAQAASGLCSRLFRVDLTVMLTAWELLALPSEAVTVTRYTLSPSAESMSSKLGPFPSVVAHRSAALPGQRFSSGIS